MRTLNRWLRGWGMVAAASLCAALAVTLLAVPPVTGWMHPRVSREALNCHGDCEARYVRRGDVMTAGMPGMDDPNAGAWVIAWGGTVTGGVGVVLDDPASIGHAVIGTHQDLVGGPQPYNSASDWMSVYSGVRDRAYPAWWPGWLSGGWRVPTGVVVTGLAMALAIVGVGRRSTRAPR